jgi:20S proteasome alpha/beta subunit
MTCIVGLRTDLGVYIGADSAASDSSGGFATVVHPKVFEISNFLVGCTVSFRLMQVLQYCFKPDERKQNESDFQYLVTGFSNKLHDILKEYECSFDEGDPGLLIGYRGRLYHTMCDFSIMEYNAPYVAIGSGGDYALGSMYSTAKLNISPEDRIRIALESASFNNSFCSEPYTIKYQRA